MQQTFEKVWLITGVSSGLGKALAKEALNENNIVVGTVRREDDRKTFEQTHSGKAHAVILDQSVSENMEQIVQDVIGRYGRIDVLVNNAGYGLIGFIEEASDLEVRSQMEVNFFSSLKLTQLVLPYMRKEKSGHIIQVSSRLGIVSAPGLGIYAASKFAMEGFSEALAKELAPFNIKVSIVEPGPMRTEFFGRSPIFTKKSIEEYYAGMGNIKEVSKQRNGKQDGDPIKVAKAILAITKMEKPPVRLPLTGASMEAIRQKRDEFHQISEQWEKLALDTKVDL
jgi:short-subunit dehydrogenase